MFRPWFILTPLVRTRAKVVISCSTFSNADHGYYPLCVSRRIDTWQIVYLSYKDTCPKISIHKSEINQVH